MLRSPWGLPAATMALQLVWPAAAQMNEVEPQAPKGLPAPRTADGHIDFSGVYYAPGNGPRDLNPGDVPLLPSAAELMRQRAATNSKDDPEGLFLPMGTPRKDPYPWKIVQIPTLFVILYDGNVHSYR